MATWHTDYLYGSDTTGNGSDTLPYKSILKAVQVGASNDIIKVAGSDFTTLSGTITIANIASNSITTSISYVGILIPGNIITIIDPIWPDNKQLYKVFSVTATTIVLNTAVYLPFGVSYTISKMDLVHYYNFTTTENLYSAGTLTNIDIQGGWTNGFTTQTGITAFVYHGPAATSQSSIAFNGLGQSGGWKLDRFAFINLTTCIFNRSMQWYVGELWFSLSNNPYSGSGMVWPSGAKNQYFNMCNMSVNGTTTNTPTNDYMYQFNKVFLTHSNQPNTFIGMKMNGLYVTTPTSSSIGVGRMFPAQNVNVGKVFIKFRQTSGDEGGCFSNLATDVFIIGDMEVVGTYGYAGQSLQIRNIGTSNIQINLPTRRIEEFPTIVNSFSSHIYNYIGNPIYVTDIDGTKVVQGFGGMVFYADPTQYSTGTNSLRTKSNTTYGNAITSPQFVMVKEIITTGASMSVVLRMKASIAATYTFGFVNPGIDMNISYNNCFIMTQSFNLTTSWADYTLTGLTTPSNYTRYGANRYIKIGYLPTANTISATPTYIWVD